MPKGAQNEQHIPAAIDESVGHERSALELHADTPLHPRWEQKYVDYIPPEKPTAPLSPLTIPQSERLTPPLQEAMNRGDAAVYEIRVESSGLSGRHHADELAAIKARFAEYITYVHGSVISEPVPFTEEERKELAIEGIERAADYLCALGINFTARGHTHSGLIELVFSPNGGTHPLNAVLLDVAQRYPTTEIVYSPVGAIYGRLGSETHAYDSYERISLADDEVLLLDSLQGTLDSGLMHAQGSSYFGHELGHSELNRQLLAGELSPYHVIGYPTYINHLLPSIGLDRGYLKRLSFEELKMHLRENELSFTHMRQGLQGKNPIRIAQAYPILGLQIAIHHENAQRIHLMTTHGIPALSRRNTVEHDTIQSIYRLRTEGPDIPAAKIIVGEEDLEEPIKPYDLTLPYPINMSRSEVVPYLNQQLAWMSRIAQDHTARSHLSMLAYDKLAETRKSRDQRPIVHTLVPMLATPSIVHNRNEQAPTLEQLVDHYNQALQ